MVTDQHSIPTAHRGFTLLEALSASVILLLAVMATSMAMTAGHQHRLESQDQVQAALISEAKMAQILAVAYDNMDDYHGQDQSPGNLTTALLDPYPDTFDRLGRRVSVVADQIVIEGLEITIEGWTITIEAYDETNRVLCAIQRFVPEPTGGTEQ